MIFVGRRTFMKRATIIVLVSLALAGCSAPIYVCFPGQSQGEQLLVCAPRHECRIVSDRIQCGEEK